MRFPIISAINDLLESKAITARAAASSASSSAKMQEAQAKLLEHTWGDTVHDEHHGRDWQLLTSSDRANVSDWEQRLHTKDYFDQLRSWARWMARFDPLAKSIIRNYVRYIWGTGPRCVPEGENKNEKLLVVWEEFEKSQGWFTFGSQLVEMLYRDGEVFIFDRGPNKLPRFRLFDPGSMFTPADIIDKHSDFGIKTNPEDVTDVKGYYLNDMNGGHKFIPASKMLHIKINAQPWEKRGRSTLEVALDELNDYRTYRKNRTVLHRVRTLFAVLINAHGATPKQAEGIKQQMTTDGGTDSKGRSYSREIQPGTTIVHNKGDVSFLNPNMQAGDAFHDAREIKLAIAASQGMSEVWLTADSQNANFASQQVAESPSVRMIEAAQRNLEAIVQWIFTRVVNAGVEEGKIAMEEAVTCSVEWPALIHRDIKNETEALAIQIDKKITSVATSQVQLGRDPEREKEKIEQEKKDNPLPPQLIPVVPGQNGNNDDEEAREAMLATGLGGLAEGLKALVENVNKLGGCEHDD